MPDRPVRRVLVNPRQAFLEQIVADHRAGTVGDLDHYQTLFPGDPGAIADEFAVAVALIERGRDGDEDPADAVDAVREAIPKGTMVGPYEVLERIAGGGQGVVYRARDPLLEIDVALKIQSLDGRLGPSAVQRFRREARLLARVAHPNVCAVLGSGTDRGRHYFAMRFVDGPTLADVIRDRRSQVGAGTADDLRAILLHGAALAEGVDAIHAAGVLHRDLKPANIVLEGGERPVIVDFGLARDVTDALTQLTLTGQHFGTIGYMPPEQFGVLRNVELGPACDQFALAAVLFEWIAGAPPFDPSSPQRYEAALRGRAPRGLRRAHPAAHRGVRDVLRRALAFDPRDRFATMTEFATALRRLAAGEARPVAAPGPVGAAIAWTRRNPRAAAVAGLVAGTLAVALAVSLAFLADALRAEAEAVRRGYGTLITAAMANITAGNPRAARLNLEACPDAERGFEHAHLLHRLGPNAWERSLTGPEPITAHAPGGGKRDLTGGEDGGVWLCEGGKRKERVADLGVPIRDLWADPTSGRWIAWGARSGEGVSAFGDLNSISESIEHALPGATACAASPDLSAAFVGGEHLGVFRLQRDGRRSRLFSERSRSIVLVASPAGDLVALRRQVAGVPNFRHEVILLRADSGEIVWRKSYGGHAFHRPTFSASGRRVLIVAPSADDGRTLLELRCADQDRLLARTELPFLCTSSTPAWLDEDRVVVATVAGELVVLDGALHAVRTKLLHGPEPVLSLCADDGQDQLITASGDGRVRGWQRRAFDPVLRFDVARGQVVALAFDAAGERLAVVSRRDEIVVFSIADGEAERALPVRNADAVAFGEDGELGFSTIAWPDADSLRCAPAELGRDAKDPGRPDRAIVRRRGRLELWFVGAEKPARDFGPFPWEPTKLSCDPRATRIAFATEEPEPALWRIEGGRPVRAPYRPESPIEALAYELDGDRLACGTRDGTLAILDGSGVRVHPFDGSIGALAFFPDGARLAVAHGTGRVSLCDPRHAEVVLAFDDAIGAVSALAVSADGSLLAAGDALAGVVVWSTGPRLRDIGPARRAELAAARAQFERITLAAGTPLALLDATRDAATPEPWFDALARLSVDVPTTYRPWLQKEDWLLDPLLPPRATDWLGRHVEWGARFRPDDWATARALLALHDGDPARALRLVTGIAVNQGIASIVRAIALLRRGEVAAGIAEIAEHDAYYRKYGPGWQQYLPPATRVELLARALLPWEPAVQAALRLAVPADRRRDAWDGCAELAWRLARAPGRDPEDYRAAEQLARRAVALGRGIPDAVVVAAACSFRLERQDEAYRVLRELADEAGEWRELSSAHLSFLALAAHATGHEAEARSCRELLALHLHDGRLGVRSETRQLLVMVDDALAAR